MAAAAVPEQPKEETAVEVAVVKADGGDCRGRKEGGGG